MKTQNPWMGRARGSAGNMTSSKVYDKNVMRAKAFEVNNPKTAAQTNERNFFAETQRLSQNISEEQLRSLFGVKPKSKSRRNELLSQLLQMYVFGGGHKHFDSSKFQSIGNGPKVNTPFIEDEDVTFEFDSNLSKSDFGSNVTDDTNIILVLYNNIKEEIVLINTNAQLGNMPSGVSINDFYDEEGQIFGYATCPADGKNHSEDPWGTFTIKTRAV